MNQGALALPPSAASTFDRPAAPSRRWVRRATTAALGLAVALAIAVAVAASLGYRTEIVLTGSMRPTIAPNDMVLVHGIAARSMRVGDIVSFAAPDQKGIVITHRVRTLRRLAGGRIAVTTRGDANNTSEHWTIAPSGSVARVVATIPGVGAITDWAGNQLLRLLVFGIFGLAALVAALRWVWSRP